MLVNCLLKARAFCMLVMAKCCWNWIVVLGGDRCSLLERPAIVFHSLCVLCLWSHESVRCCFQRSCLCCCIFVSISLFMSWSRGSL